MNMKGSHGLGDDIVQELREIERKKLGKARELREKSKPLSQLVIEEEFTIKELCGQTFATKIIPISEIVLGGRNPTYSTGYTQSLILKVIPKRNIPVKNILFNGYAPFRPGEKIIAKIPRYKEVKFPEMEGFLIPQKSIEIFYFDRKFISNEEAIELSSLDGKEVHKSSTYSFFLKK